jgi:uncharacterized protein DUF3570
MQLSKGAAAAFALVTLLRAGSAQAQWAASVDGRTSLYHDSDRTTISTTAVAARISPFERLAINGRYLADIITSASVDVVTAATPHPFHDTRHEGTGSVSYQDGTRTASVGYIYSVENDWRAHTGTAGFSSDFFNHRLTVGIGGGYTTNDIFRSGKDSFHPDVEENNSFHRKMKQGNASLDVGLVATRRDLLTFDYTFVYVSGFQASPYRFVPVTFAAFSGFPGYDEERDPETRVRHAASVRWNHHAFKDTAIKSHLRGYADDWGLLSITGGVEYVVGFNLGKGPATPSSDFELGVFARGYAQNSAAFYQAVYDQRRRYMTADRELSSLIDAFGGLRLAWARRVGVFDELRAEAKGTGFVFHYFDFPRLEGRTGLIGEIALGGSI